jgi:alkylation response protein AidB-like acyl-CoA dehydrogenase
MVDGDDLRLLTESLAHSVTAAGPGNLRRALQDFGWDDLLAEDPAVAVATLASLQGEHLTTESALADIMLVAARIEGATAVVLPNLPQSEPTSHLSGDLLMVSGVTTWVEPGRYAVPAWHDGRIVLAVADLGEFSSLGADGIDPSGPWRQVRTMVTVPPTDVIAGGAALEQWQSMRAAGHRALAHEIVAIVRRMLELALDHAKTREQFGRPIASFQAVKHALADVEVWLECAGLAASAAWEDGSAESAILAKILAGKSIRVASASCQQVLGGMGFTWEHEFHRYLRRGLVLERLLGSAPHLRAYIGSQLRTVGVPQLAHL